ncbi:MAG: S24 family peptidase, partial [Treponemataceae bacterium]
NIDWLLTGDGEPFLKDEKAKEPEKSVLVQEIEKIAEQVTYLKMENRLASVETKQEELESLYKELYELYHNTQTDKSPEEVKEPASTYEMEEETVDLPLAVSLAAGLPIEAFDTGDTYPVPKSFLKKNEKYCVARICGTSMTELGIVDGSVVLVRHTSEVKNGAICVVRYGENTTLKKLERTDAGDWVLRYCDGSGAIIPLENGDWEVKGEFVAVVGKKDKTQ